MSYLVLPLHRCECEFCVFLLERKETAKKPLSLFFLPSALGLLSAISLKNMVCASRCIFVVPVWKTAVLSSKESFSVTSVYLETCEYSLGEYGFPNGGQPSPGFVLETKAPLNVI